MDSFKERRDLNTTCAVAGVRRITRRSCRSASCESRVKFIISVIISLFADRPTKIRTNNFVAISATSQLGFLTITDHRLSHSAHREINNPPLNWCNEWPPLFTPQSHHCASGRPLRNRRETHIAATKLLHYASSSALRIQ